MSEIKMPKKLGFGLMRLPKRAVSIDVEQTKKMVDLFLEAGCTYFDTAFVYPGSEAATKKALVDRHPRDSYTIATKLFAAMVPTEKAAKDELHTSLRRLGTDYVDFYLLHSLMENNYKKYEKFRLWDFVNAEKARGTIRHIGFSFHGGPALLDDLLTQHPEVEFVQLQINYADWEDRGIASRRNYEVARKHGKLITIMEPVKGGNLANPPAEIRRLFDQANPGASCASWAIRFAASLEGVLTVLSGMSNLDQMRDNLSYMSDFRPLSDEEYRVIHEAQRILGKSNTIPCTACSYCTKGCPQGIPIPDIFKVMNRRLGGGQIEAASEAYRQMKPSAADCVECGACEEVCPQHLPIRKLLKDVDRTFGA